ncbi:hypothetical protein QTN47_16360 [Danxiaibacter flavus]|uniref:Uncharacterized protein n=1 Tax=Danxiaibacter flavus TaxID=3049108 RepID=A0ABV3ZGZ9_9BACT|nr:hypothetical protein QNM32_16370 [Chitinophagaceae bacterium DXS]
MPNTKTDKLGFSTENPDTQRNIAAKGPSQGVGKADSHHAVGHPYDEDLQTQITAKSKNKKQNMKKK